MIKKIFLFILILFVLYILAIFKAPELAGHFEKLLKIEWFNQSVIDFKKKLDEIYTTIPTKEEIKNTYEQTMSWAIELKEKASSWTIELKNKIDNVRLSVSWSIDKYEWIKSDIVETKEKMESTVETIKNTSDAINDFSENLKSTSSWILNYNQ